MRLKSGFLKIPGTRRGIAMATSLGALVIIGVLIAGVFFTSNQELRVGTNTLVQERAFRAAEFGLNATLASWDNGVMTLRPIGTPMTFVYDSTSKGWVDSVAVTRLNATTYLLISTARAMGGIQGESRRRTGLLVRLSVPVLDAPGALTTRGDTKIGGSSLITGFDTNPVGWTSCPVTFDTLAALSTPPSDPLTISGCPAGLCLQGWPKQNLTTAASDTNTYFDYKDEDWTSLTQYANKIYTGSQTFSQIGPTLKADGTCDKLATQNWGAPNRTSPAHPCETYFPIIHATGTTASLKLTGGAGQGVLLVDGDLELTGGFSFYGPVIVRGSIKSSGAAGNIKGALMVANLSNEENSVLGDVVITYSSCAVETVLKAAVPPKRVVERAWTEIF